MWCTPPRGGGEGHLNSIVLGACHPTPALSDESEIISRALHWTAGSEWLRPVKHPCVVVCMGLGSLAGRRDGDERQRGARAGARCRPCRQEAQHSNSARVDFGDLLEALSPPDAPSPTWLGHRVGGRCLCQTHLSCRKHYAQLIIRRPIGLSPIRFALFVDPSKNGTTGKWKCKAGEAKRGSHLPHTSPSLSAGKVVCTGWPQLDPSRQSPVPHWSP